MLERFVVASEVKDPELCTDCPLVCKNLFDLYQSRQGGTGLTGPPGPPGPSGPSGPPGAKGDRIKGEPGTKGDNGQIGRDGRDGLPGLPGVQGIKGEVGQRGDAGPPGQQGPPGEVGSIGPMGPIGQTGARGLPGIPDNENSIFSAYKTSAPSNKFTGLITYDVITIGEELIDKSTGVFTVKVGGVYMFSYSGEARKKSGAGYVGVYLNDIQQMIFYDKVPVDTNHDANVSYVWTLTLQVGDKVHLKCDAGKVFVSETQRAYFNGWLVKAV